MPPEPSSQLWLAAFWEYTAPTEMAVETHAGAESVFDVPSLPEATATAIPASCAARNAAVYEGTSASQYPWSSVSSKPPPSERFNATIPYCSRWATAQSTPARMSESSAVSSQVAFDVSFEAKTLTATIFASGATPEALAATEATEVPCPSQSIGSSSLSAVSVPPITLALGKPPAPIAVTV